MRVLAVLALLTLPLGGVAHAQTSTACSPTSTTNGTLTLSCAGRQVTSRFRPQRRQDRRRGLHLRRCRCRAAFITLLRTAMTPKTAQLLERRGTRSTMRLRVEISS